jgi:hypothetical protein
MVLISFLLFVFCNVAVDLSQYFEKRKESEEEIQMRQRKNSIYPLITEEEFADQ